MMHTMMYTPKRLCALALLVAFLCMPWSAHAQAPASDVRLTQVDNANYPEVTVYVSVNDESGNPRSGLTQDDFTITEDGEAVDIINFTGGGNMTIYTALVIDRSGSMEDEGKLDGAQDAAQAFVTQMRTEDQTTIIGFDERPETLQAFTSNQGVLQEAIDDIDTGDCTAIYDSVIQGVDALNTMQGRRVLLLLTDGQDCRESSDAHIFSLGSTHTLDEAITYANDHEQPVYVVGLGGRSVFSSSGIDEEVLEQIADQTHGEYFYAPEADQLVALYKRLSGNIHEEYALTYRSPRPFYDGTRRNIEVQVGEATSSAAYTEKHLINVHSNLLVGILLLIPLLGLLALPNMVQRMGIRLLQQQLSKNSGREVTVEETTRVVKNQPVADDIVTNRQKYLREQANSHANANTTNTSIPHCASCGANIRPNARFCGKCGARQPGK